MKRFCLISGLICTITLIISMTTLLVLALINHEDYKVTDSIVFIKSIGSDSIKDGMGFVYKNEENTSYIVTNYHVIDLNEKVYVYNKDNKKIQATIVDYDKYTDIAVLKIEEIIKELKIGSKQINLNDEIYYFNIDNKILEKGKILSLNNEISINASYGNSFYNVNSIKGNITSGNSGSPVLNKENEVIGMISLKLEDTEDSFYIPIDNVMKIVSKLENHTLERPNLGATFVNTTNVEILNQYGLHPMISGVAILDVQPNSSLHIAGVLHGDIITKVNEVIITDITSLQKEIYSYNIGEVIQVEIYRNNIPMMVSIVLNN